MTTQTSTKYRVHGAMVLPFTHQEGSVVDVVPAAYYKVEHNPFIGYYLVKQSDTVETPDNIFGSTNGRCARIFEAYEQQQGSLGVGLFGKKGAGKSLLASVVGRTAIERGIPVIDVSESFTTDSQYLNFLNSIKECVIIFDEFLKHLSKMKPEGIEEYDDRKRIAEDRQDEMLTFFQGTTNTKRIIVLIDNNKYMLSDFLQDRPGRMRYIYEYEGVETEVVQALAAHHGATPTQTDALVIYAKRYRVSFDVINEVIKEWVRYPQDSLEAITSILNVPTLRPDVEIKARIVAFTDKRKHGKGVLKSELCTIAGDRGRVKFTLEVPNPLYGQPKLTAEQFEDDDKGYPHGYYDYEENWDKPMVPCNYGVDDSELVALRGNQQMYSGKTFDLTVEIITTTTVNESSGWGFHQDAL